jgi:hypothetical protein
MKRMNIQTKKLNEIVVKSVDNLYRPEWTCGRFNEEKECYWFMHKIFDVIDALLQNGIVIQEFDEYNFEMANNKSITYIEKLPISYMLIGKKGMKAIANYSGAMETRDHFKNGASLKSQTSRSNF